MLSTSTFGSTVTVIVEVALGLSTDARVIVAVPVPI